MIDSLHDSVNDNVSAAGIAMERFKPSRAPAEQGAGSREQGGEQESYRSNSRIMALRAIHPIDGLAVALAMLRPDWDVVAIRATLDRSNGSHRDLARRALTLALDPGVRTPNGIENGDMRRYDPTPVLPSVNEALNPELCDHKFRVGACPICRRTS